MQNPITVLVVDDSMLFKTIISKGLSEDPSFKVVATAGNPYEARDKILQFRPDVITLDVEMPRMSGLEFLKILMQQMPLPVVMVSAVNGIVFEAIRAGAVDFVAKPTGGASNTAFIEDLKMKIKIAYSAKLSVSQSSAHSSIHSSVHGSVQAGATQQASLRTTGQAMHSVELIAIGASTGGTEATSSIMRVLPENMPGILITQHMPPVFTKMYAERLNRECALSVKEAASGDLLRPGCAYVAPGDKQMRVVKQHNDYILRCVEGEKVSGHCPSVDVLFESVAACAPSTAVGIILTGMGSDGARGLLSMRKNGSFTIGQDQKSSVVYGMPMEAQKIGAVVRQASLDTIPSVLLNYLKSKAI